MVVAKAYQLFEDSIRSKRTKTKYLFDFNIYCEWIGIKNYNKLVNQAPKKIEDQLKDYLIVLDKQGDSYATIHTRYHAILKFYSINRINLNTKWLRQFIPEKTSVRKDVAYTHEQIAQLLNSNAYFRDKMMILIMCSAGLRIGGLEKLTYGDLTRIVPQGYERHIYKIEVYQGTKEHYYTFTTFECAEAIDQYLDFRVRNGETLTKHSPLFREQFDIKDRNAIKHPKFLSYRTFHTSLDRLLISSGIRVRGPNSKRKQMHEQMAAHGFRKFCNTQMIKAGIEYNTKEFIMGHKITRGLDNSYDRTPEHERLAEYTKALDLLTISPENRLRKKVAEQEYTIQVQMKQVNKENIQLRKEMQRMRGEWRALLKEPEKFMKMLNENRNQ